MPKNNHIQKQTFTEPFVTESGFAFPKPEIAYKTWGSLNKERDNVVIIFHALTGNVDADEWFGGLFNPGGYMDTDRHYIICTNVLGSCYGTTGPLSVNPDSGDPYLADFPNVTIRDIVRFQQMLLDKLDVRGVELVIGGSMGGMQALEFCIMDDRAQSAVLIGMGKSHRPWAIGISHTQRRAIYADPNWNDGYYDPERPPAEGLSVARMIAMNSYRSPGDFDQKFGRDFQPGSENRQYQVESYLNYQGDKLVGRFDANSYVRLTEAMDSHDVGRGRSSARHVLGNIRIPVAVVGIDTDVLYPTEEQKELASFIPKGVYHEITSLHGHDAFLIEFDQLNKIIRSFKQEHSKIESY